jgi:hypothetical protein
VKARRVSLQRCIADCTVRERTNLRNRRTFIASGRSCVCHTKRWADLIMSAITRSEFMRHKTHADLWRAMPHSAYPKNNLIRLVQKIIAKTFLNSVVRTYSHVPKLLRAISYLFERITLFANASGWTRVKAIFASRKTANIASGTLPARSEWKPLSKSLPHFGS